MEAPDQSASAATVLVILGGLPGVGKTTVARAVARRLQAAHVRIDSVETAIARSEDFTSPVIVAGYEVGYAVAADQLALGLSVVADSVNPLAITRAAWLGVAAVAGVPAVQVEVVCSDVAQHRNRVESRVTDVPGLTLPTWAAVQARDYEPWEPDVRVDTAYLSVGEATDRVVGAVMHRLGVAPSHHD